jgi:hypothetical protein
MRQQRRFRGDLPRGDQRDPVAQREEEKLLAVRIEERDIEARDHMSRASTADDPNRPPRLANRDAQLG